jgi:glycosyltransferase involved in cell wall biosynthesis
VRVAYFVGIYHRFTGSQRSLWLVLRAVRDPVEPVLILPGEGAATARYRELGLPLHVVPAPAPLREFGGGLLAAGPLRRAVVAATAVAPYTLRLLGWLRRERIQLLHCNDPRAVLLAAPAARLLGIPVVFQVRGHLRRLGPAYVEACARLSDRIVLVSQGIADSVPARHRRKLRVVHNGIDVPPPAGTRDRAALGLPAGALVVAAVGSLVPFKGLHHLVEAVRRLGDPRVVVVLVGDRPDAAYGRHLDALAAGLDVRFPGWDPEPGDWFRAADVVCLPTVDHEELLGRRVVHSEGFSRSVLEAMAHARPVIATRVGGAPEQVVDGETGLLVPPSDAAALAAALGRLAADPALRARMGEAGRRRAAERFSMRQAVDGLIAVYRELLP